jgi:hypothetical protein
MYKSELSYKYGEYNAQAVDKAIQWSNNFGNNECSWQQPINHDQELENSSSPSSLVTQKNQIIGILRTHLILKYAFAKSNITIKCPGYKMCSIDVRLSMLIF